MEASRSVPTGTRRQLFALQKRAILHPRFGEMKKDAAADNAAADHENLHSLRQIFGRLLRRRLGKSRHEFSPFVVSPLTCDAIDSTLSPPSRQRVRATARDNIARDNITRDDDES